MNQLKQTRNALNTASEFSGWDLVSLISEAEAGESPYLNFAERLASHELEQRHSGLGSKAGLPSKKHLEGFGYGHRTTISKRQVNALLDFRFLDERHNLILIGQLAVGKTHPAIGLGKSGEAKNKELLMAAGTGRSTGGESTCRLRLYQMHR